MSLRSCGLQADLKLDCFVADAPRNDGRNRRNAPTAFQFVEPVRGRPGRRRDPAATKRPSLDSWIIKIDFAPKEAHRSSPEKPAQSGWVSNSADDRHPWRVPVNRPEPLMDARERA